MTPYPSRLLHATAASCSGLRGCTRRRTRMTRTSNACYDNMNDSHNAWVAFRPLRVLRPDSRGTDILPSNKCFRDIRLKVYESFSLRTVQPYTTIPERCDIGVCRENLASRHHRMFPRTWIENINGKGGFRRAESRRGCKRAQGLKAWRKTPASSQRSA